MTAFKHLSCCLLLAFAFIACISAAGIPMARYEALMKQQSIDPVLYNATDKVNILTSATFKDAVVQQNRSTLVEFYNSYCGHCKRFAPIYKELAEQLHSWQSVLPICAIDCAAEQNNDICREYQINGYPTMRYFSPDFNPQQVNNTFWGKSISTLELDGIRTKLAQFLAAENRTDKMPNWPNLEHVQESEVKMLFEGQPQQVQYVVLVYQPEDSTLGVETALHFLSWPNVQLRIVSDKTVAAHFQIDGEKHKLASLNRAGHIVPYTAAAATSAAYIATIESLLRTQHITEKPQKQYINDAYNYTLSRANTLMDMDKVLAEVKRNKHLVYQADLEMAIKSILSNEIPKASNISGERLLALQRFLAVLKRYNPLGVKGQQLLSKLNEFVLQFNEEIDGQAFEQETQRLENQMGTIFSSSQFIGCAGSMPARRGYTCSLWQLFHYLTIQAANTEHSQDALEVLQAVLGYVKHFFGCTDCSQHFQEMASRRKIWSVPNKDEACLWLWSAHNEVNQRLAGDATEDPQFPKIQFPSQESCALCYRQPVMSPANLDISWNKNEVLSFLKNIYNPAYISRFGVDDQQLLQPSLEKLRQKRMINNVFTDIDMRMGMLLYGFCIVMVVAAFKLFVFKGYRKKSYGHDLLSKVLTE